MTRINCVPVEELTDKHLGAEYRELPRLFNQIKKAFERGESPNDPRNPKEYKLGTGHTRFFYNKLGYLVWRQMKLVKECKQRGRKVTYNSVPDFIFQIPGEWWETWWPDNKALEINRERIKERLNGA